MPLAMISGRIPTTAEGRLLTLMSTNECLRLRVTKLTIRPARPLVETIQPLDSGTVR